MARDAVALEAFWSRVDKREPDECWPWTGAKTPTGYGNFYFAGTCMRSHRLMWELVNGEALGKREICHQCHNPSCNNPVHLAAGDRARNNRERDERNRKPEGEILSTRRTECPSCGHVLRRRPENIDLPCPNCERLAILAAHGLVPDDSRARYKRGYTARDAQRIRARAKAERRARRAT